MQVHVVDVSGDTARRDQAKSTSNISKQEKGGKSARLNVKDLIRFALAEKNVASAVKCVLKSINRCSAFTGNALYLLYASCDDFNNTVLDQFQYIKIQPKTLDLAGLIFVYF